MAKIVSEKIWLKVNRQELEDMLAELLPDDVCQNELVEIQVTGDSNNNISEVTFGFRYKLYSDGPSEPGPLGIPDGDLEGSSRRDLRDGM